MHFCDVVDEFHDQNGFANAGTAKQTNFTTFGVGGQKVDHFDACYEDFSLSGLLVKLRCIAVNGACRSCVHRAFFVNGVAGDVHDATQCCGTHGHRNLTASVFNSLATHEAFGGVHSNGAHCVFAKVLGHFENEVFALVLGFQGVQDLRQVAFELNIDDGADDLGDFSGRVCHIGYLQI